jgi:hypothetical protein
MTPVSVYDEAIKELVYVPVDVCLTEILVPGFFCFPWNASLASRKWSKLVRAQRFKSIRKEADRVYLLMEELWLFCPTVSLYNPSDEEGVPVVGLQLDWQTDDRLLRVFIARGFPYHYARGRVEADSPLEVCYVDDEEAFFKLLPVFARYIQPPEILDDGKRDCA